MAKISARGDRELARWTGGKGRYVVLTQSGRILVQSFGDGYKLMGRFKTTPREQWITVCERKWAARMERL